MFAASNVMIVQFKMCYLIVFLFIGIMSNSYFLSYLIFTFPPALQTNKLSLIGVQELVLLRKNNIWALTVCFDFFSISNYYEKYKSIMASILIN